MPIRSGASDMYYSVPSFTSAVRGWDYLRVGGVS
jgi:hypothetical protein